MIFIPTILSGGSGSRLWPVSRMMHPKPFIRLADGQSFLQKAYTRALSFPETREVLTVTGRDLFFQTEDELRDVNTQNCPARFILEPFGRNTAPAVISAALEVQRTHGDDAVMLVLSADHLISDPEAFARGVKEAAALAAKGRLVTFGVKPTAPETGYGYIKADGNEVLAFVEKPSREKAQEYLQSGEYLWNAGIFCFTAGTVLSEMHKHAPDLLEKTRAALAASHKMEGKTITQIEIDSPTFAVVQSISVDYALFEHSDKVAVVSCDIGWSDMGSWTSISDISAPDANGNRIEGDVVMRNTKNCFIQSDERMIGVVGIENLMIVDTSDALLVAHRDSSQEVSHLFAELKAREHETHKHHRTVYRPWGTYTILEEGAGFKIKRLEVKTGASLSLQMHHHRSEHWVVVSGTATVTNGEKELTINSNESTYIPAGNQHRLSNFSNTPLVVIETQTGAYLGEDDIVRFDDVYGRVATA